MHIHPNNNLLLASLGAGREEVTEVQAKRVAEVRKRLSAAKRAIDDSSSQDLLGPSPHVERHTYESEPQPDDDDSFGRLFSVKA